MKTLMNNSTLNPETTTYGELKRHLPSTEGKKLPTAKRLKENGEVLFSVQDGRTLVTVYTNGFLAFTQPDEVAKLRTTVFAVDRCKQIIYKFGCSDEEYEDVWEESSDDMKIGFRIENGRLVKLHIISERVYTDSNWLFPVSHICEERLRHNGDVREDSHIEYRFGDESWENALVEENFVDRMEREQDETEKEKWEHETLEAAKKTLTEVQRRTIELYFGYGGTTEATVAGLLGTSQQNVHKNLAAALKKIKKFFEESGC